MSSVPWWWQGLVVQAWVRRVLAATAAAAACCGPDAAAVRLKPGRKPHQVAQRVGEARAQPPGACLAGSRLEQVCICRTFPCTVGTGVPRCCCLGGTVGRCHTTHPRARDLFSDDSLRRQRCSAVKRTGLRARRVCAGAQVLSLADNGLESLDALPDLPGAFTTCRRVAAH